MTKIQKKRDWREVVKDAIEDAKRFFENSGYILRKVLVTTGEDNMPARRLYEKIGFTKSGELKDLFGKEKQNLSTFYPLIHKITCDFSQQFSSVEYSLVA